MNYTLVELISIGLIAVGLIAGAVLVAQRPSFWIGFGQRLLAIALPFIWKFIAKRMSPEDEAKWRKEQLTGVKPPKTGVTTTKPANVKPPKKP